MTAHATPPVTSQQVAAYFTRQLGAPVTINKMKQSFPGVSRETWLVDAEVAGEKRGFALRIDHPWGSSCAYPLRQEWEVYSRLWKSQVPVAEPLWFNQDIDFAGGRPHMVRNLVDGSTNIPGLADATAEGAKLRQRIAFECAEKLALVHTLDWKVVGLDTILPEPKNHKDALREELRCWRTLWDNGGTRPDPLIEDAMCWLDELLPAETPFVSLCKGNNGLGEEIWRGEKIVAMSDWEMASLSDGTIDLAFSQGTLTLADFGATLRHYEKCVGHDVSPQRLAGGMFVTWFKMYASVQVYMAKHYYDGSDLRIVQLSFGEIIGRAIHRRLAACIGTKDIVAAWASVSNQEQSSYFRVEEKK